jgi:hypothetical protein
MHFQKAKGIPNFPAHRPSGRENGRGKTSSLEIPPAEKNVAFTPQNWASALAK